MLFSYARKGLEGKVCVCEDRDASINISRDDRCVRAASCTIIWNSQIRPWLAYQLRKSKFHEDVGTCWLHISCQGKCVKSMFLHKSNTWTCIKNWNLYWSWKRQRNHAIVPTWSQQDSLFWVKQGFNPIPILHQVLGSINVRDCFVWLDDCSEKDFYTSQPSVEFIYQKIST